MIKVRNKSIFNIISNTNFGEINSRAAEMSFYLLLSLFPFLMFTIVSVVYIPVIHLNKYITLLETIIPESAYNIIATLIHSAIDNRSMSVLITSFFLTLWASSRAVRALIKAMNKSYKIKETRSYIKRMSISFVFTIGLLLLIFTSIIFLIYGEKIGIFIFSFIGLDKFFVDIWNISRYSAGVSTVIIILACLYKFTPNKRISIKESMTGAVVSTFGWLIVSFAYSFYTNSYARYEMIYGSIGGIIVLITWLYLSSWTILLGAEINAKLYDIRNIR